MPETSKAIFAQLNTDITDYESVKTFGAIKEGAKVGTASPLFARIDAQKMIEEIKAETEAKIKAEQANNNKVKEAIEGVAQIGIDDFAKVKLRTGEITACEKIKKSKKLLKIQVDDARGGRQIVSGIAEYYTPEELIGKKIIFVANLSPAKLCGEESNGMLLACDAGDKVQVVFLDKDTPNGSTVR